MINSLQLRLQITEDKLDKTIIERDEARQSLRLANESIQKLAKQLTVAYRWSAAWKRAAKRFRNLYYASRDYSDGQTDYEHSLESSLTDQRRRTEAAEKRIKELERRIKELGHNLDSAEQKISDLEIIVSAAKKYVDSIANRSK